jgi:hypothetical protein
MFDHRWLPPKEALIVGRRAPSEGPRTIRYPGGELHPIRRIIRPEGRRWA